MNSAAPTPPQQVNVCLHGQGIVCGLAVYATPYCDIELSAGTAIAADGTVINIEKQSFGYYLIEPSKIVQTYFPHDFSDKNRSNRTVLELVSAHAYDSQKTDSLKQQTPHDLPTRDLLTDKIMVVLIDSQDHNKPYFLLVSPSLLLEKSDPDLLEKVKNLSKTEITKSPTGFFQRPKKTTITYANELIERAARPYLQLPELYVPRFGYKKLAIKDDSLRFGTDNFVNPFTKITSFKDIFGEYKAILDDLVPAFETALKKLHTLYGHQLTHKGTDYWTTYRTILVRKWQVFLEDGEHLYYIQYFYDWLVDLVKAYDELCQQLSAFVGHCHCHEQPADAKYTLIRLGSVLGGSTSYTPVLFRDYFEPPMIDGKNAEHWNEIKFLHWRLMMMIWTFDLPQLKLDEKVLVKDGYLIPAKEFEDSTNYFEKTNKIDKAGEKPGTVDFEDVPLKLTPGQTPDTLLGEQAIPYYYPLDADSPYSLHQYWNYPLTQMHRTRHIRSYNAIEDGDSYTATPQGKFHKDSQYPLAYHLRQYPFLRAEGHIGKLFNTATTLNDWKNYIETHNLSVNVTAVALTNLKQFNDKNAGLEHIGGLAQGQTLVLVYADADEDIILDECKKPTIEIKKGAIVADFTVPTFVIS